MKKVLLLVIAVSFCSISFSQLSGTYTIGVTPYLTIASAIADLNTYGVTTPGVTFDVPAGYTEAFTLVTDGRITTTTSSPTAPIVFQKSGSGTNPKITGALPSVSLAYDGIIVIVGTDNVTFDGIDLQENTGASSTLQNEWGYALLNNSTTDGCQEITIKNCSITLNKTLSVNTTGIYTAHINTAGTAVNPASTAGAHNSCKFFGNSIQNVYCGIKLNGSSASSPYTLYDNGNEIGKDGANIITNFGGGTTAVYGIYTVYQNNQKIANNNISGGTSATSGSLNCIYATTAYGANVDIYANTISLAAPGGTTGAIYGIYNTAGGSPAMNNSINIYSNTIQDISYTTSLSATIYGLYSSAYGNSTNIYGNTIQNLTLAGTGAMYPCYIIASYSDVKCYSNTINNIIKTGAGGTCYGLYISGPYEVTVHDNTISNINYSSTSSSTTGLIYGYFGTYSSATIESNYNNTISGINVAGASTGSYSIYGMYTYISSAASSVRNFYNNQVNNINYAASGYATVYGLYHYYGGVSYTHNNKFYNFNANGASSIIYGVYLYYGVNPYLYNNYIYDLRTPAATNVNAIMGIYVYYYPTYAHLFYNTIYLNATSTASTFGTSGIYYYPSSTSYTLDLRNNIIVNTSTPKGTTGYTIALRFRGSSYVSGYQSTSNNNCLYAGTPGTYQLLYGEGTSSITNAKLNITDFKAYVGPTRDNASVSENPPFISITTPHNLHLQAGATTLCESGAARINSPLAVTDDYDGDARWSEPGYTGTGWGPDIGADEAACANTTGIGNPQLNATLGGPSQINIGMVAYGSNTIVMVFNTTGTFTTPSGAPPAVGSAFAGGTVLYTGGSGTYNHSDRDPVVTCYYKAWSVTPSNEYSTGNMVSFTTPTTSPYFEGFEGITAANTFPPGFIVSADARSYLSSPGSYNQIPHTGSKFANWYYSPAGAGYMVTPGIYLYGGTNYAFSTWYITDGLSGWYMLKAMWTTTPTNTASWSGIPGAAVANPTNTTYSQLTGTFTPPSTGVYYLALVCEHSGGPYYLSIDDISLGANMPYSYIYGQASQANTTNVYSGTDNNQIIGIKVNVDGISGTLPAVSSFKMNTAGSTSVSDISDAKLWYTGTSNTFALSNQFGQAVINPNGTFYFNGSQQLATGNNYFWLTYSLPCTAVDGNVLDAMCDSVKAEGVNYEPIVTAPAGNRTILGSITVNASVLQHIACTGIPTGSVTANPAGGIPPYTFYWTGPDGFTSNSQTLTDLWTGIYSVTVYDSYCLQKTGTGSVTVNNGWTIEVGADQNLCDGQAISIQPVASNLPTGSGTLPFSSSASGTDASNPTATVITSGAPEGTVITGISLTGTIGSYCTSWYYYKIILNGNIVNNEACNGTFNITDLNGFAANGQTIQIKAFDTDNYADGVTIALVVTLTWGYPTTPPSLWTGPDNYSSTQFNLMINNSTGLNTGWYFLTANFGDCYQTDSALINISDIQIAADVTQILCNGEKSAIDITVTGGYTPYSYLWSPNGETTDDLLTLDPGTYTISVTDVFNCIQVQEFVITQPPALTVEEVIVNASCFGFSDGSITLDVDGGTPGPIPYNYIWSDGSTTQNLTDITTGIYSVTITDANNCILTATYTVTEPDILTVSEVLIPPRCKDEFIDITVTGGTTPYLFIWSSGETIQNITGILPGSYTVTITDAQQCVIISGEMVEPSLFTLSSVKKDADCNVLNNGWIDITPEGGITPYTYLWSNGSTTQDINTLTENTYTVTITDDFGCQIIDSWYILDQVMSTFSFSTTNGYYYHFVSDLPYSAPDYIITWNFGDGSVVTGPDEMYHTFYSPGVYLVSLNIVSANAAICNNYQEMMVVVEVTAPCDADAAFTATQSTADLKKWNFQTMIPYLDSQFLIEWYFGDGNLGYGQNVDYTYANYGNYTVYAYLENYELGLCFDLDSFKIYYGCMDPDAFNYNQAANGEDGSCIAKVYGCMDPDYLEYDPDANTSDPNACITLIVTGCMDPDYLEYDPLANVSDPNACLTPVVFGCTDPDYLEFDPNANTMEPGSCVTLIVTGCMDPDYLEYDPLANVPDPNACLTLKVYGCTDPDYLEYDANANTMEPGSCVTLIVTGCMDPDYLEFDPLANVSDPNACITLKVYGCIDPNYMEFDPDANTMEPGSCVTLKIYGCMDPYATNYNPNANTAATCEYIYNMNNTPVTTCQGYFYDSGGPTQQYGVSENFTKTFYPLIPGNRIKLTFTSFNTEGPWDKMWIYNGNSSSAPVLLNGATGPLLVPPQINILNPQSYISSAPDGSLTVVFTSNSLTNADGWSAVISCEPQGSSCITASDYGIINDPTISGTITVGGNVAWWKVTLDQDYNNVVFATCPPSGNSFNTIMEVWDVCTSSTYIGQNDNSCGQQSKVTFTTLPAGTYYIKIYGGGVNGSSTYNPTYYLTATGCPAVNLDYTWDSPASGVYNFQTTTPFPSSAYSVVWNFGDGNTASGSDAVTHNYAYSNNYTVTCTATFLANGTCVYTKNYQVAVFACTFNLEFTWTDMGGGNYEFTSNGNYSSAYTILWTFGDGGYAAGSDVVIHNFATSGHPVVSLYVVDNLHQDCWRYVEHVVPVCNVDAEFTVTQTGNGIVQYSLVNAYPGSDYYIDWSFGDGSVSYNSLPTVTHNYANTGDFNVTVLVTYKFNYFCWDYTSQIIPVPVCGVNVLMSSTDLGFGQYQFDLSETFMLPDYTVTWNFGDGSIIAGSSSINHTYLNTGNYHVIATVQHTSLPNCMFIVDSFFDVFGCTIDPDFTWTDMSDGTLKFELQDIIVSGIWSFNWSFGDGFFDSEVPAVYHEYAAPGTYAASLYVYNVNNQACNATVNHQVTVAPVPGWNVIPYTGLNHSIIIPANASILINNTPISIGDYIGVFYLDDSNNAACGGYIIWNGTTTVLTAWGDDPVTLAKDGFGDNEAFVWILWKANTFVEYPSTAAYLPVGGGITHQGNFANNGISGITSLDYPGYTQQIVSLHQGWGIMSTYINPLNPAIDQVFAPVMSYLGLAKNGAGNVLWPSFGINMIGNMVIGQGYQVYMTSSQQLPVVGFAAVPETTPVNIPANWSILGYLRQTPGDVTVMLNGIISNIYLVKDELGMVYFPLLSLNGIGDMNPGKGYMINLTSPALFYYPANGPAPTAKAGNRMYNEHYTLNLNTGNNMSLGVPVNAWTVTPNIGDEIGVFNASGELIGSGVYSGSNLAIPVWGDDMITPQSEAVSDGDVFCIKLWKRETGNENSIVVENWLQGNEYFESNAVAVVGKFSGYDNFQLYQNIPNPFRQSTRIKFYLPESGFVKLEVYNVLGEVVSIIVNETLQQGEHQVNFNPAELSTGTYMYRLTTNGFTETRQMDFIK